MSERAKLSRLLEKAPSRGSSITDEAGLSHALATCAEGSMVTKLRRHRYGLTELGDAGVAARLSKDTQFSPII